jgi:6-phosphogluconolactonase
MTLPFAAKLEILADPEALARRVAQWMLAIAGAKDGVVAIALAGGTTPRLLYRHLAAPPHRDEFPWARTHWFWGDERFVPPDDPRSNYHMAQEAMLSRVPIPSANLHPMPTEAVAPEVAAALYEQELKSFYGADRFDPARPLFDINLLGLGTNGHTASLFPGTSVLRVRDRWAAAVTPDAEEPRITLTYPALESAGHVAFLVAGAEKRAILGQIRRGEGDLPAARVHPVGTLTWFADQAAAGEAP